MHSSLSNAQLSEQCRAMHIDAEQCIYMHSSLSNAQLSEQCI
jgi:hypothetical protein